jgi:hypothetical protein
MHSVPLPMLACPKFAGCSAPLCPLDAAGAGAVHLKNEPVCAYLLASAKAGAAEHYAGDPVFLAALAALPRIAERWPDIKRRISRAATTPIRGGNVANLVGRNRARNAA